MKIFNPSKTKSLRQKLRSEMPKAEKILWNRLRNRQLDGKKFRRQYGIGPFIVDFYCAEMKLAIELDGDSHFTPVDQQRDFVRQQWIEQKGIRFLRFTNVDIFENLEAVMDRIAEKAESSNEGL